MYVGEAGLWVGWAETTRGLPVTVGALMFMAAAHLAVVREERTLLTPLR